MIINGEEFFESSDGQMRSPETSFVADSSSVTRGLQLRGPVDEQRRFRAAKALLGYASMESDTITVGGVNYTRRWIERQLPHAWITPNDGDVNFDGVPFLYAASVPRMWGTTMYTGGLDSATAPEYSDGVLMQVKYAASPHFFTEDADQIPTGIGRLVGGAGEASRPDEGHTLAKSGWLYSRYIIRKIKHAPKLITVAGSILQFSEGRNVTKPVPGNQNYSQYRSDVQYTWVGVPVEAIPHNQIGRLSEKVNHDTFDFAPKGTLRLASTEINQYRGPLGNMLADVTYHMQYMPNWGKVIQNLVLLRWEAKGWNSIPAVNELNEIENVYVTSNGAPINGNNNWFKYGNFAGLFRPPQALDDAFPFDNT